MAKRARKAAAAGAEANPNPEDELEIAKEQFPSTVIGGRYANCTKEWREQGKQTSWASGGAWAEADT